MTYDETGSCLSDPDAQISIQQSIRDAVTNIQHVPNTCPTEHARPHFEEQSLGVCLQEACLGEHLAVATLPCGAVSHCQDQPEQRCLASPGLSQLHEVRHHRAWSAANGLTVQSGTGLHLKNHARHTSLYVQLALA